MSQLWRPLAVLALTLAPALAARAEVAAPTPTLLAEALAAPTPAGSAPAPATTPALPSRGLWAAGLRSGYSTIPNWALGAIFDKYMPINGWFIEGVAIRRLKENLRLYLSLTGTFASAAKGVWQRSVTKTPNDVEIDVGFLSADALFDWELRLHSRFAFHFGAGLGLGALFGTIKSYECQFVTIGGVQTCQPTQAPRDRKAESSWPVYPVLHLVAGTRIELWDRLSMRIDFDFRNAFGLGVGVFWEF